MLRAARFFFVVVFVACAGACVAPSSAPPSTPAWELRTYDVPPAMLGDVASTLNNLMWRGESQPKAGNVGIAPNGQLLVSAPAEFHPGVRELVEHLKGQKAEAPPALALDVWLVTGVKGDATAGAAVSKEIADVIDDLQKVQGPLAMELLEHTRLQMTSGSQATAKGLELRVDTQATLSGDGVLANLELERRPGAEGALKIRTLLPLGKTVVLGQVGAIGSRSGDAKVFSATAFYVVRASKLGG